MTRGRVCLKNAYTFQFSGPACENRHLLGPVPILSLGTFSLRACYKDIFDKDRQRQVMLLVQRQISTKIKVTLSDNEKIPKTSS